LLFVFWVRRKSSEPQTVYAPSYDDIAPHSTNPAMKMPMGNTGMPTDIASLDLNLQPPPPAADPTPAYMHTHVSPNPVSQAAKSTVSTEDDTEQRKLHLAAQLSDKGDKDLARALILSVISSSSGDLKAKAIQQLGQIR